MTPLEAAEEMRRLSDLLDRGLSALREQAHAYAAAENAYRKFKAACWLDAPDGTVPERQAWVDGQCADLRRERDLAEGMRQAALEAVRSRRAQISAWQTLLNADRAELELVRFGPEVSP